MSHVSKKKNETGRTKIHSLGERQFDQGPLPFSHSRMV